MTHQEKRQTTCSFLIKWIHIKERETWYFTVFSSPICLRKFVCCQLIKKKKKISVSTFDVQPIDKNMKTHIQWTCEHMLHNIQDTILDIVPKLFIPHIIYNSSIQEFTVRWPAIQQTNALILLLMIYQNMNKIYRTQGGVANLSFYFFKVMGFISLKKDKRKGLNNNMEDKQA